MTGNGKHVDDAALGAVERVRGVRETDSRIGLQRALAASRERQEAADAISARLDGLESFSEGSILDFRADRVRATALAQEVLRRSEQAAASLVVAAEAERRWAYDRSRLRAVQLLLERRKRERAAEQARREARELDDIAGQAWLRRRTETSGEARRGRR